jgi:hypothetical protein
MNKRFAGFTIVFPCLMVPAERDREISGMTDLPGQ